MFDVLATTTPVFLLIGLGYVAVRLGLFSKDDIRAMARLVVNIALPPLLFLALARQPLATIANPAYLLAYGLGSLAVLLLGVALFRMRGRSLAGSAVPALGMANSNSAFVGLPVALQFLGPVASVAVALSMLVENLLILQLTLALAEGSGEGKTGRWRAVRASLAAVARNPLILAIIAGTLAAIVGLELPAPLATAMDMLARASTPMALFVIGGMLVGLRMSGMIVDIATITVGKLILHPLFVFGLVLVFLPGDELGRAAVILAAAPMFSIFPLIGERYGLEEVTAASLLVTTAASFVTLTLLLWLI